VKDTTLPELTGENISEGAIRSQAFRGFIFDFSKPLDPSTVNASTFTLEGPGGTVIAPTSVQLEKNGTIVEVTYPTLALGDYAYVIDGRNVTDTAGNSLGDASLATDFTVQAFSTQWNNAKGGDWNTASNWSTDQVPGAQDAAYINLPLGISVTYSAG